jgi:DNA-binding response OmpR family regulator
VIKVLIIDPENQTAKSVAEALSGQEMLPIVVGNLEEALQQLDKNPPHAVVLAAYTNREQSEGLCRAVCERTLAPLLVVGKLDHDLTVERMLSAGADAHVLEPFSGEVLVAQLWALLRRVGLVNSPYRV